MWPARPRDGLQRRDVGERIWLGYDTLSRKTLQSRHASGVDKFLAVVDLGSNVLTFVPIFGEGVEAAKLAAKLAVKVGSHVAEKEVSYEGAVQIVKRLARRGARDALEGCTCFPAGTLVATPHGSRAIDALRVGDTVLSEDPATGKVEAEMVQAAIADGAKPVMALALSDGGAITVTADHPFWVDAGNLLLTPGWLHAGQLRVDDRLRTAGGAEAVVVGLRRDVGRAAVYSLTVARDHTFFVGTARVLVHNASIGPCLVNYGKNQLVKFRKHGNEIRKFAGVKQAGKVDSPEGIDQLREIIYSVVKNGEQRQGDYHGVQAIFSQVVSPRGVATVVRTVDGEFITFLYGTYGDYSFWTRATPIP